MLRRAKKWKAGDFKDFSLLPDKAIDKLPEPERMAYLEKEDAYLDWRHYQRFEKEYNRQQRYYDNVAGFNMPAFIEECQARALAYVDRSEWSPANPTEYIDADMPFDRAFTLLPALQESWRRFNYFRTHSTSFGKSMDALRGGRMYGAYLDLIDTALLPAPPAEDSDPDADDAFQSETTAVLTALMKARFDRDSRLHPIARTEAVLLTAMNGMLEHCYECGLIEELGIDPGKAEAYMRYQSGAQSELEVCGLTEYLPLLPAPVEVKSHFNPELIAKD